MELRRDIHRRPELRFAEHRTAELLSARLRNAGYEVTTGVARTGVVARLARGDGPAVVIRADLDALPLTEANDVEYRSTTPGVMHACGHDVHMAVVVTAAERLAAVSDWAGTLTVLLQPAEEIPFGEESGARAILESGAIDFAEVDAVFGLHCWPWLPAGVVGIDPEVAMASKDAFQIEINGAATHAAAPADGRDALLAMSHLSWHSTVRCSAGSTQPIRSRSTSAASQASSVRASSPTTWRSSGPCGPWTKRSATASNERSRTPHASRRGLTAVKARSAGRIRCRRSGTTPIS